MPVILSVAGFGLLLFALLRKQPLLVSTAYWVLLIAAVAALPVYLTGEGTAERLEKLPGITENSIESHEEVAESAFIAIELVGVLSILGLIFQKRIKLGKALRLLTLLFAFVAAAVLAEAAHLGGQIRHSEIRKDAQPQSKGANSPGEANAPRKGDD
ncbi:MAG TPA: hypothetical protein VKQ52_13105 [Puia sp.]|nr:hypothetical protein [Puia sp.]